MNIPANFWRRVGAQMIDMTIFLIISLPFFWHLYNTNGYNNLSEMAADSAIDSNIFILYVIPIIYILYEVLFTASKYQGTLGKQIVKIKVVDKNFAKLSIPHAFVRFVFKSPSTIILMIIPGTQTQYYTEYLDTIVCLGFLLIFFTQTKQALHDILAQTYVVYK